MSQSNYEDRRLSYPMYIWHGDGAARQFSLPVARIAPVSQYFALARQTESGDFEVFCWLRRGDHYLLPNGGPVVELFEPPSSDEYILAWFRLAGTLDQESV